MKILGLTGGIGTGKSTVATVFKTLGVPVYNSDVRARELYFEPGVRREIENTLGKKAYKGARELDKEYIRNKLFADGDLLKKVNSIIHPAVAGDFEKFLKENKTTVYVVKETALLFEAGIDKKVDKVLTVTTSVALRAARLAKRDGLSAKTIEAIASNQMADAEKVKKSDWVIENNEEQLLIPQVLKIHKYFLG